MQGRYESYIRSYRRKIQLSQDDVAFLLGKSSGTSVSRHERGRRAPTVHTALAYEIILGQPVGIIFRRYLTVLRNEIGRRATQLLLNEAPAKFLNRPSQAKRRDQLQRIAKQEFNSHHDL